MEINITRLFKTINPKYYSASRAELGPDAGAITWNNAIDAAPRLLKSKDQLQAFAQYVYGFGAWSEAEIKAWSVKDCNALLLQLISGDIREADLDTLAPDWIKYQADSEAGRISGRLFCGIDGDIYYYIGD